jgi:uncharacterized protein (TIGR02599 family)
MSARKPIEVNGGSAPRRGDSAFTLVELLVAAAVLAMLVALILNMVTQTSKTWRSTSGKIEQFRDARDAFDAMTRKLSQATLNSYLDYDNPANPRAYIRQSELRFLSGPASNILGSTLSTNMTTMAVFFQAPAGFVTNSTNSVLQNVLNTWGYFLEYGSDTNARPGFLPSGSPKARSRYRLMEFMEPTESLSVYNYTATNPSSAWNYTNIDWISNSLAQPLSNRPTHVLADNVIALILLPKLSPSDWASNSSHSNTYDASSLAPNYVYDSSINQNSNLPSVQDKACLNTHNQLPPVVQVTLIAVDETTAVRFPVPYSNLATTFSASNWFTAASNFQSDLSNCQSYLITNKFNFRVFTTDVMIRGAKWSTSQTN